jgi:4-amino-4-deoxy-L-arabinose transferase-like glycosyltransferase
MFTMPSMWNLVIFTIVFFAAAWYIHRYLDEQGIPKGTTRGILVLVVASLLSWGAGYFVDMAVGKPESSQAVTKSGVAQLMKAAGNQVNP